MSVAWLKPGRERSVLLGHPWIFSTAIEKVELSPEANPFGETIDVLDSEGDFLARGAYSPQSQIRIRIWTRDPDEAIDEEFFQNRLQSSLRLRENLIQLADSDAIRLVHAESDGLPGLIVDRYAETTVVQFLTNGVERWREPLVRSLIDLTQFKRVYERSDVDVRRLEGLEERSGEIQGGEPPDLIEIRESGFRYLVDIQRGQKTGFYLDQRENRSLVRQLAKNRTVLDCFAYTGGFTVAALLGGASHVSAIDSSVAALEVASKNLAVNALPSEAADFEAGDVFQMLRKYRDRGEEFDMIILDPPKFAPTIAQAQRAARGYKDINLLALKLLRSDGLLVTFSCSGGVSAELFQKIIAGAARDAHIEAKILFRLDQAADHPVSLTFQEGMYLKGFVISK